MHRFRLFTLMLCASFLSLPATGYSAGKPKPAEKLKPVVMLKAGPAMSLFIGDVGAVEPKVGLGLGLEVGIVPKVIGVQTGFNYIQRGTSTVVGSHINLDYLVIPALMRLNVRPIESTTQVYFMLGTQLGLLMSAKAENKGTSVDVKKGYNSTDAGIRTGLGVDVNKLCFQVTYDMSIAGIIKNDSDGDPTWNMTVMWSIGYRLK